MSDQHMDKHDEQKKKESNYKKFLLYGILLVLVVLVGYVIFAEDKKMYRLATETKLGLRQGVDVSSATTPGSTSSSNTGSSSSSNPLNLGLFSSSQSSSQSSSAPALTSPTSSAVPSSNVMLSPTSGGSASEVRRELRELFRSYA